MHDSSHHFLVQKRDEITGEWNTVKEFYQHTIKVVKHIGGWLSLNAFQPIIAETNYVSELATRVAAVEFAKGLYRVEPESDIKVIRKTVGLWTRQTSDATWDIPWSPAGSVWQNGKWQI